MNNGLKKGVDKGVNRGIFSNHSPIEKGLFALQERATFYGDIDPHTLGQPAIHWQSFDSNFVTTIPVGFGVGNSIRYVYNYDDSSFFFERVATNGPAILVDEGKPFKLISWETGNFNYGGYDTNGATTSSFPFFHQQGNCKFTIYFVFRNYLSENTGTTKVLFSTAQSTGQRGVQVAIGGAGGIGTQRAFFVNVLPGSAGIYSMRIICSDFGNVYYTGVEEYAVYSIRVQEPTNIGDIMGYMYRNGVLIGTGTYENTLSATTASGTLACIGNRTNNNLRFGNQLGEFIAFNGMHDEITHQEIVNNLIKKWEIPR